jgi:cyclophilin family peptidyl-prolyl cis-trans isomerase
MFSSRGAFGGLLAIALLIHAGCGGGETPTASISGEASAEKAAKAKEAAPADEGFPEAPAMDSPFKGAPVKPKENLYPEILITTSQGEIRVRLNAEKAPVTVDNFLMNYARRGFYEGTIVHYVAKGNIIAAGGFTAEFEAKEVRAPILNEATNQLSNKRGTLAMARDPEYAQSATSQFFINVVDNPALDHKGTESSEDYGYCVFGEVVAGMDIVDAIANAAVHDHGDFVSTPVEKIVIEKIEQVK